MHLKNHLGTALITGASSGIGAVYDDHLARRDYDLILVARNRSRLEAIASCLRHLWSISVETVPADLTQRVDLRRVEQGSLANHRAVLHELLACGWRRLDEPVRNPCLAPTGPRVGHGLAGR